MKKQFWNVRLLSLAIAVLALGLAIGIAVQPQLALADGAPTIDKEGLVYSGQLTQGGQPMVGKVGLQASLYNTANASDVPLCIKKSTVDTKDGRFSVGFDSPKCVEAIRANKDLWLVISVAGDDLTPVKLSAVPYAHVAEQANGLTVGATNQLVPPGTVVAFAGPALQVPQGWALCDGKPLVQSQNMPLYANIGTTYGNCGNKVDCFNLPDYRARFLRGAGVSADGKGGEAVELGAYQADEYKSHQHAKGGLVTSATSVTGSVGGGDGKHKHIILPGANFLSGKAAPAGSGVFGGYTDSGGNNPNWMSDDSSSGHGHGFNLTAAAQPISGSTDSSGGAETRPKAYGVNYIIKL